MITVVAKLQANPGKESEVKAALSEMVANVKKHESGKTVAYSLHVSETDPTQFLFYEQYADDSALEAHRGTDHMKALGGKLAGLLAGRAQIERYTKIAGVE